MQLPLTKENDSNEEIGRQNAQQESKSYCCAITKIFPYDLSLKKKLAIKLRPFFPPFVEVPDKENQTNDSEVILRRTQSFENDDK